MKTSQHHKWLLLFAMAVVVSFAGLAGCSKSSVANNPYPDTQFAALQTMVNAASAASTALSGNVFADWEKARPDLGQAITGLDTTFGSNGFDGAIKRAAAAWPGLEKTADLPHARTAYLKVSDNLAQVLLAARKNDPRLAKVVVFYCPMTDDPVDARWVQTAAPLKNPFWGPEMVDCGSEVKP
jgi:hypothetical protein